MIFVAKKRKNRNKGLTQIAVYFAQIAVHLQNLQIQIVLEWQIDTPDLHLKNATFQMYFPGFPISKTIKCIIPSIWYPIIHI